VRPLFHLALVAALAGAVCGHAAYAQDDAVYRTTYVEVMPNSVAPGIALLKHYRDASRQSGGNLRFDVLAEIGRPNRFVILETWSDKTALVRHPQSADEAQFLEKLKLIEDAPPDERMEHALYLGHGEIKNEAAAIYVVTHIDVIPPGKEACMEALKTMSVDTAGDPGNIDYEVLQQADHLNHFTVIEEWADRKAADAHAMALHTRAFRAQLIPIRGALYDERFYKALN
jgi:quinol monooxygenase YgiN